MKKSNLIILGIFAVGIIRASVKLFEMPADNTSRALGAFFGTFMVDVLILLAIFFVARWVIRKNKRNKLNHGV